MLTPPSLTGRAKKDRSSSVISFLPLIAGIRFSLIFVTVSSISYEISSRALEKGHFVLETFGKAV